MSANITQALKMLKNLPRVNLSNLKPLPGSEQKKKNLNARGKYAGGKSGRSDKGQRNTGNLPRLGFEGGNTPFYMMIPKEPFYKGWHARKSYKPMDMHSLQRMIDLERVDAKSPIDMATITNTRLLHVDVDRREHGVWLTEDGADSFTACINIEVQWASEVVIAAVERNGGSITTRYYDPMSLHALSDTLRFFKAGKPIPRCHLPTQDVIEYYTNPQNRGYLADPDLIREARWELSQKYGYTIPEVDEETEKVMAIRKDTRQVFFNLEPGWIINLKEKCVYKPTDSEYVEYYKS